MAVTPDRVQGGLWHLLAERPPQAVCAMIRASDEDGSYLLPGPVRWDESRLCWIDDTTDEPVRFPLRINRKCVRYHWADELDLCRELEWAHEHEITGAQP